MNLIAEQISDYSEWQDLENPVAPQARARYLADLLILSGYRGMSNKYRIVGRLDRPDWMTHMAQKHAPWDPEGQGLSWVIGLGLVSAADHYQACYSQDRINGIPDTIYHMVKRAAPVVDYLEIATFVPRRRGMSL